MLCKIAGWAQPVQQIVWRDFEAESVSPDGLHTENQNRPAGTSLTRPGQATSANPPARASAAMEQRSLELDRTRKLELAHARQEGVDEGLRQGREAAAGEVQNASDRLARTLQEVAQQRNKLRAEAEREIVKLSLAIAQRILFREISTDPDAIAGIVNAALQKLQKRNIARVKVYPAGAPAVRAALERTGNTPLIEVVPDPSLAIGGLLFETSQGDLDASIETQLQEIQRGFADRLVSR
jgi:flagellar assembly protein FliH